ncbi:hypothetical protein VitviT2T_005027 [Vitis vinifera]|uniref:Beta-galactosidase 1-like first all-beta domain-containing protein n=1 Tax=Vitis vinifera TaxID=29760 RepID=A0ABY9BSW3_VITVI|nr:hypothetical protein VitviT2T_005027 [Vitis vinifera]
MVGQTLDFTMVPILVQMSLTTSQTLLPMIMMHQLENLVMWTLRSSKHCEGLRIDTVQHLFVQFLPTLKREDMDLSSYRKTGSLFDLIDKIDPIGVVEYENPTSMESVGQMFGFLLYTSGYAEKDQGSNLFIPNVHDRAQVFISCPFEDNSGRPTYVGTIERWSNQNLSLPDTKCASKINLFVLVENMGRVNYGSHLFNQKGILSLVYLDGNVLKSWKIVAIFFQNLNEVLDIKPIKEIAHSRINKTSALMNIKKILRRFP